MPGQALSLAGDERVAWLMAFRENNAPLAELLETLLNEQQTIGKEQFL